MCSGYHQYYFVFYVCGKYFGWMVDVPLLLTNTPRYLHTYLVVLLMLKTFQLAIFDMPKAIFYHQARKYNFNISTFVVFNLCFCQGLFSHYFLFNYIFDAQATPCFGGNQNYWYKSTVSLFNDRSYVTIH